jgi:hypothetical protein
MTKAPVEFLRAWHEVVSSLFVGKRYDDRVATVRQLLDVGIAPVLATLPKAKRRQTPSQEAVLEAERMLVDASGMFDPRAYTTANGRVRSGWVSALEHFCDEGWRELCNPGLGFDLWWYWSEYLDPARTTVNPLVHYLLDGRFAGHSPLPEVRVPVEVPATVSEARRICLFAAYDPQGVLDEYVLAYVRELSRHADVYYLFDGYLGADELGAVAAVAKGAWAVPHGRYDFGSYSMLARDLVGWDVIEQYDELVLANDSTYLLRDLDQVFAEMRGRRCDWWGLQASKHDYYPYLEHGPTRPLAEAKTEMIGRPYMDDIDHLHISSYFLVFRRRVIRDEGFRRRLDTVVAQPHKSLIIRKYEIGLSRYLMCRGFDVDTFIPDLYPFHPLYTGRYFELVARGFPLLKRNLLTENSGHVPDLRDWKQRVLAVLPEAPVDLFEANLERVGPDDKLQRSFVLDSRKHHPERAVRPLNRWEITEEDAWAPKFDHWWAFVVDAADQTLSGSLRAVFEEVRQDPTLRKVVLTRSRRLEVDGANVVSLPLGSRAGQLALARCRYVFVREVPGDEVCGWFSPQHHDVVNVGGVPLRPFPEPGESAYAAKPGMKPYRAVVTSSPLQALTAVAAYPSLLLEDAWQTGAPRNDLLLRSVEALPADLREQQQRLTGQLHGRPLLLFAPAYDRGGGYRLVGDDVVEVLEEWGRQRRGVVGFYDDVRDRARSLARALDPIGAINLGRLGILDHVIVDRVATALVSDFSARAVDFFATGREVVLWVDERVRATGYHDPVSLPATLVQDAESLLDALLRLPSHDAGPVQVEDPALRRHFFATLDDRNSARLVRRIRTDYIGGGR